MKKSLDLGCGYRPRNPFNVNTTELFGIDIHSQKIDGLNYVQANLALEPIPFEDNFFDYVTAFDFIEHIPRQILSLDSKQIRLPFVELMNQIYRVLKPDGVFYAVTPYFPNGAAFQDPTHVNIITKKTHQYFCGDHPEAKNYGFVGRFEKLQVKPVIGKLGYSREESLNKSLTILKYLIINTKKFSHLIWELQVKK